MIISSTFEQAIETVKLYCIDSHGVEVATPLEIFSDVVRDDMNEDINLFVPVNCIGNQAVFFSINKKVGGGFSLKIKGLDTRDGVK